MMKFRTTSGFVFILLMLVVAACGGEQAPDASYAAETEATPDTESAAPEAESGIIRLNINTATEAEMLAIPDVGNRMVHEFEEYRPYTSIEQFRREIGKYVDEAQVAAFERYIYVPVDRNESDAATLQQIPGVGAEHAEALIAGRPYASNEAFIEVLRAHVSEDAVAEAERMLSGM